MCGTCLEWMFGIAVRVNPYTSFILDHCFISRVTCIQDDSKLIFQIALLCYR